MIVRVDIVQLVVAEYVFSLKMVTGMNAEILDELKKIKGKDIKFIIQNEKYNEKPERIFFTGRVKSINLRNKINFVIHTNKDKVVIIKTIKLMDESLLLIFKSEKEQKLSELLHSVSESLQKPEPELLYELTTFKCRDGTIIEGKKSIYELSEKHREVLLNKLTKMIEKQAG